MVLIYTPGPNLNLNYKNVSSSILFFSKKWKNSGLYLQKRLQGAVLMRLNQSTDVIKTITPVLNLHVSFVPLKCILY